MCNENTKNSIKKIIVDVLNLEIPAEELLEEDLIETYGVNSVDALEILIHIENAFYIEIDEDDLNADLINSIANLETYVLGRIGEKLEAASENGETENTEIKTDTEVVIKEDAQNENS